MQFPLVPPVLALAFLSTPLLAQTGVGQDAYLKASSHFTKEYFGHSVAIDGNTAVVGAEAGSSGFFHSGSAYVFTVSGGVWTEQATLDQTPGGFDDRFGAAVAICGDTIVVGAPGEDGGSAGVGGNESDNSKLDSGAAYVFVRTGTVWVQQAYLKASNPGAFATFSGDAFGSAVALDGDTICVGAFGESSKATGVGGSQSDDSMTASGAAYVFVRTGMSWAQQAYLKASNTETKDLFGTSMAVDGDTILVGAPDEDSAATGLNGPQADNSAQGAGAVYAFHRTGSVWVPGDYIKAPNAASGDTFGTPWNAHHRWLLGI